MNLLVPYWVTTILGEPSIDLWDDGMMMGTGQVAYDMTGWVPFGYQGFDPWPCSVKSPMTMEPLNPREIFVLSGLLWMEELLHHLDGWNPTDHDNGMFTTYQLVQDFYGFRNHSLSPLYQT